MKTVTAALAAQHFPDLLRDVRAGETVVVVADGEPVATIQPAQRPAADRADALKRLLDRLRGQPVQNLPVAWTRDELYDA